MPQIALLVALGLLAALCGLRGFRALRREVELHRRVSRVLRSAPTEELPGGARIVPGRKPAAFCFGMCSPRVYLTRSAVDRLEPDCLAAVLAHEEHHIRRRDPLRFAVARVMGDALFFMPMLHGLLDRYAEQAELAADEAFLRDGGDAGALASALLVFDSGGMGVHPDRVDQLLGDPARTKMPVVAVAGGVLVVTALLASAMAGASVIGHAPVLIGAPR